MSEKNNILIIGIVVSLVTIISWFCGFFYHAYTGKVNTHTDTVRTHTIEHKYDKETYRIPVPIETPERIIEKPIPTNVDTEAVIRAYFGASFYNRTFADSNISATITDTVERNRLGSGLFTYKLLRPQTIVHNTTTVTKSYALRHSTQVFLGFNLGLAGAQLNAMPQISVLNTNRGYMLNLFTNINKPQPNAGIGIQKRIFKINNKAHE